MKLDILAFGAHPDDVELGCAGTLAKEITLGKSVGIIDLTRGELGTRGSAEIRDREAKKIIFSKVRTPCFLANSLLDGYSRISLLFDFTKLN